MAAGVTIADIVPLSYSSEPAYFSTDFSPEGGFYLLSYHGPDIPWQRVIQAGNEDFNYVLTDNERLANATAEYEAPTVIHSTIVNEEGYGNATIDIASSIDLILYRVERQRNSTASYG